MNITVRGFECQYFVSKILIFSNVKQSDIRGKTCFSRGTVEIKAMRIISELKLTGYT